MTSNERYYEDLKFNPFQSNSILIDNFSDPDYNLQNLDTPYYSVEEASEHFRHKETNSFSVLHLNIRSLNKNFENFKLFLAEINFNFKLICLSETWCQDKNPNENSLFQLPNYNVIHQNRNQNRKGGGVCIFIHQSLNYKTRDDLSTCTEDGESLSIEIINKTTNVIITTSYRPPAGKMKPFKNFLKQVLSKNLKSNKTMFLVGDFNLNVLDYESNTKVKNFFNLIFQHSLIPVINKPKVRLPLIIL